MTLLLAMQSEETVSDGERDRLWDLLLHSEKALTNRTHFFLIAECIFVLSYSIVAVSGRTIAIDILAVGGMGLSLVWLVLQWKMFNDLTRLASRLKDVEVSKHYLAWRAECSNFLVSHEIISVVIPTLCIIGWLLVMAFSQ